MKFGKVDNPEDINFTAPQDTNRLATHQSGELHAFIGCSKWNKANLKNFYPPGVGNELAYYSTQFNAIELNATFFRLFPGSQIATWRDETRDSFLFFPKVMQEISHSARLKETEQKVDEFLESISNFQHKFGACLLQMHNNFAPEHFNRVEKFIAHWDSDVPLHIEFRHTDWHNDTNVASRLYELLEENEIGNVIIDTAGRRDLLHMRLTTPTAYIRFVGCNNDAIDYKRLDDWAVRIADWKEKGLVELYFFLHQNIERESPKLAAYFIEKLNKEA